MFHLSSSQVCLVLMSATVAWGAIALILERRIRRRAIESRPRLSDNEIFGQFYEQSGLAEDAVLHVWHEIASALHVDAGKIRPSDRMLQYRSKVFQPQSDLDSLDEWLCMLSRKSRLNPGKLDTIDDVVRFAVRCRQID